jgi:glycosyltransferase involved in cell wall biosynthesis
MNGRPRVVHVTTTPEFVRHILIHDLRRLQARTDATVVSAQGPDVDVVSREGFRMHTVPIRRKISPLADVAAIAALVRLLRREPVDLLHSYVPKGGLVGQVAGVLGRVPARVHSCRGLLYTDHLPAWRRWLYRFTDRLTNGLAHRTIYVSRADRDFSVRERLCNPRKARYTASGIDLKHFDVGALPSDTRARVREALDIPEGDPLLLSVGRFVIDKGYRELGAAAKALRAERPDAWFVWVAPVLVDEEGALPDSFVAELGLGGAVQRLPIQEDIRHLYVAADVLVHPTYREGVPRVLMEAAAMGLPIVASDIPGCREVVRAQDAGLLVRPRDPGALLDGLRQALADPAARAARAARARAFVREELDADRVAERIWQVYEEVLHERQRPT